MTTTAITKPAIDLRIINLSLKKSNAIKYTATRISSTGFILSSNEMNYQKVFIFILITKKPVNIHGLFII
ncbi:hypothetical protein EAN55_13780 [Escherichia albertii]|nr:hypothetical protein [Escherichia albertii]